MRIATPDTNSPQRRAQPRAFRDLIRKPFLQIAGLRGTGRRKNDPVLLREPSVQHAKRRIRRLAGRRLRGP
jgi:hypothetical protein